jgi:xanthine/CO dehydrogenase XdhC/CoxF family maturation factor
MFGTLSTRRVDHRDRVRTWQARNEGAAAPGSPVTFCDGHRTDFATAGGQIQPAAGILTAVQVVFAPLRALHLMDRSSGPTAIASTKETVDKEHCR